MSRWGYELERERRRRRLQLRVVQVIAWATVLVSAIVMWCSAFAITAYVFGVWHP